MTTFCEVTQQRKARSDSAQRRKQLAVAALHVLGEQGMRGFTHRAVDAAADLPTGSVNYHAPTRERLLELAVEELFVQDMAVAQELFSGGQQWSAAAITAAVTQFIDAMTRAQARYRVVARHHLVGASRTNPVLRDKFEQQRAAFVRFVQDRFADVGHRPNAAAAELCVIVIEGLIDRQVHFEQSALDPATITSIVEMVETSLP
ncbi:TetR/AcrR family transcriptional regulator [Nocardia sp. NPDC049526]|uniref:TetR/AcrR family transcriptional regulator n=1 Tax=Nocardia sp. NPDC049526 TaxID=3364316 RepID=UPI0037B5DE86